MNYKLFEAINGAAGHHTLLDHLMIFVSQKALIIYALVLLVMWFLGKEKQKYTVVYAALTAVLGLAINFVLGHIYYEPRPFVTHKVHLLISHAADASFPSDHTTGAFSLALAVFILGHRKIGIGMILFGVLTGISRIYVGHHYPFDVLGGFLVSLCSTAVIFQLNEKLAFIPRIIVSIYNRIPVLNRINADKENKPNF